MQRADSLSTACMPNPALSTLSVRSSADYSAASISLDPIHPPRSPVDDNDDNDDDDGGGTETSDLVHVSRDNLSRSVTPLSGASWSSPGSHKHQERGSAPRLDIASNSWDSTAEIDRRADDEMPSDLRSEHHQPLLPSDKARQSYNAPSRPNRSRRSSRFRERDNDRAAAAATKTRYTYAGCFLLVSLVSFAVQTETAVYVQHNLHWNKAYCML